MLLAIDIGNSSADCGVFRGTRRTHRFRIEHGETSKAGTLARLIRSETNPTSPFDGACMSSVAPERDGEYIAAVRQAFGMRPLVATCANIPIKVRGYDLEQIGADRLLAALAAYERYRAPVIVVDAGTAITIDYVNGRGEFCGGVIFPGASASARLLERSTALLPRVDMSGASRTIAKNTAEAIRSGLRYGYAGAVDGIVERMTRESRAQPTVVATGGEARLISRASSSIVRTHDGLVLEGLRITWESSKAR